MQLNDINLWRASMAPLLSDTVDLPYHSRGLLILAAGTLVYEDVEKNSDTIVVDATWIPFFLPTYVRKIKATGTTIAAANIRIGR